MCTSLRSQPLQNTHIKSSDVQFPLCRVPKDVLRGGQGAAGKRHMPQQLLSLAAGPGYLSTDGVRFVESGKCRTRNGAALGYESKCCRSGEEWCG